MKVKKPLLNSLFIKVSSRFLKRTTKLVFYSLGIIFFVGWLLSFTDVPYNMYYGLGTNNCELYKEPHYIVLLGGGGMPSPDGLIRSFYTAGAWHRAPKAKIIIAIPSDTSNFYGSPELQMANELVMRGVDSLVISFERKGYSTYSQAIEIAGFFNKLEKDTLAIRLITTPEHMFRSVRVFRKAGFKNVGGTPAFETGLSEKKLLKNIDDDSSVLDFRYNMWSYMIYEITVAREYTAIAYYKLRGWI